MVARRANAGLIPRLDATARKQIMLAACLALLLLLHSRGGAAAPPVPGAGQPVPQVGDDFEDPDWYYDPHLPKNSADVDQQVRNPGGRSRNGRWYEGTDRGQPDVVRRVVPPADGIPGSTGALLIASLYTGTPGRGTGQRAQDDLFLGVKERLGRTIPVSRVPSAVVRVYLPPTEEWENASGASFAFRTTVRGINPEKDETEAYWPGIFLRRQHDRRSGNDTVYLVIRASEPGGDYTKMPISQMGWWTLGMSFSPDGRVHYYAHPGVEDLTSADRLASHNPYGFRCTQFVNVFFDVFNANDGKHWSTGWVIDDPTVYAIGGADLVRQPSRRPTR